MKMQGGYRPKVAGRPSSNVRVAATPERLFINLRVGGREYRATVDDGARVRFGQELAVADAPGGTVSLTAPATGTVRIEPVPREKEERLILSVADRAVGPAGPAFIPRRATAAAMRQALAAGGVWPLIWSSQTGGMPELNERNWPRRILINCVAAEPFRTRGKVVLAGEWKRMVQGLRFLQRFLDDYGTLHLVLTEPSDPVAAAVRREMAGKAWVKIENVPLRYPVEHADVLWRAWRRSPSNRKGNLWVMDAQAVTILGACLGDGIPLHERILAVGGPGAVAPAHVRVRVGTRFNDLLRSDERAANRHVLKGGMMRGEPADAHASVDALDDGVFVLPRPTQREFLGFARPGTDKRSILPCFVSSLTGAPDRALTSALRGERRPCIACGLCERVCPVGLMPQMLHRALYGDAIDQAEFMGVTRCIGCGLCSHVCPSKLDLSQAFAKAREQIRLEHEEAAAAEAERQRRDVDRQHEQEHGEEWRQ